MKVEFHIVIMELIISNPFFRPLFEIEPGIIFVGAISHPQDRHRKMKNKPDFRKIFID
ncbi:hypothetical protein AAULH_04764 [Lactobacillus helveticus MTCC 5463]|nr:hypothetical protein AAULH_04764 [Lactobacillus helveticus MTCC 5463]